MSDGQPSDGDRSQQDDSRDDVPAYVETIFHAHGYDELCNHCCHQLETGTTVELKSKLEGATQLFEDLLAGIRAFIRDRGRHDGPHSTITPPTFQGPTVNACAMCELAYIEAEAKLDECVRDATAALEPDEASR